jgi:hypothetical protein
LGRRYDSLLLKLPPDLLAEIFEVFSRSRLLEDDR